MLSCGRLRNTVNCVTSSCLTSLRVLHTAQLTVLCDYVSKACKFTCYTGRNCCFCILIRPSLTADRSILLLLLQLQASVARSTVNAVVSILFGEKSICLPSVMGRLSVSSVFRLCRLSEHKPTHFKRLAACDSKDIDFGECASVITVLCGEFASRFEELRACSSDFHLFTSPFDCVVDDMPDELPMEVVELQCNVELKSKFLASSPLAFFSDDLSERDFPHLVRNAKKIAAMFGSTYCCEQLFSKMKIVKYRYRAQLSDEHLNHILLLSSSSISPDISTLCSEKHQYHSSH